MPRKISEQVWTQWAPAIGIAVVMFCYALFHYHHALNMPFHDDIYDILQLLVNVTHSTELVHTLQLFFEEHNVHRTLSSRLIYYLSFLVEGEVNFRTLTFLANMALPLLLVMLYFAIRAHRHALLILCAAALILFQPRIYGLSFWSMTGFAYMFVYVYGFASLLCLRKVNISRFLAAVLFATLGTFTLASGQIIWLVGLIGLLHQALVLRRVSLAYSAYWILCAVLVLLVWRIGYDPVTSLTNNLAYFVAAPSRTIAFFMTLLGSALSDNSVLLAASAGGIMLGAVCLLTVRDFGREDISLDLLVWYIVISVFSIALGRASALDLDHALLSRYSFPSVLLLATLVVLLACRIPQKVGVLKLYAVVIFFASAYWVFAFQHYRAPLQESLEDRVRLFNAGNYWAIMHPMKESNAIVMEAVSLGIYRPPRRPHPQPDVIPSSGRSKLPPD